MSFTKYINVIEKHYIITHIYIIPVLFLIVILFNC